MTDLLRVTPAGLYCDRGDFWIDPRRAVHRAVVTHAHGDHLAHKCKNYFTSKTGELLARERVGNGADIQGLEFGETLRLNEVEVSMFPAGHILGSAQVRVQAGDDVWVVSGDYKLEKCTTCEPFETVRCNTFISEATFALPIYKWQSSSSVFSEMDGWWRANQAAGKSSVVFAYALGKAQRIIAGVDNTIGPILVHDSVRRFVEIYRAVGISLPEVFPATATNLKRFAGQALIVTPSAGMKTLSRASIGPYSTAFASGWMLLKNSIYRFKVDRGFVISDHADWEGLLTAIEATQASRVLLTHGNGEAIVAELTRRGKNAQELEKPVRAEVSKAAKTTVTQPIQESFTF